jgi:DNA-binding transcriptional ArsR family regulator
MLLTKDPFRAIIQLTKQLNEEEDKMGIQKTLKALSDPIRRDILEMLRSGRHSAGDISERFSVSAPAISKHLNVLKDADLIRDRREGKYIYYELNTSVLEEIMLWVADLKGESENEIDKRK